MKKTVRAFALLFFMALGIPSLTAAEYPPHPMIEQSPLAVAADNLEIHTLVDGMRMENTDVIMLAGNFDLRSSSFVSEAHAAPMLSQVEAAPIVSDVEKEQPSPVIGAWFIGFGFLAFVISRKRFRK